MPSPEGLTPTTNYLDNGLNYLLLSACPVITVFFFYIFVFFTIRTFLIVTIIINYIFTPTFYTFSFCPHFSFCGFLFKKRQYLLFTSLSSRSWQGMLSLADERCPCNASGSTPPVVSRYFLWAIWRPPQLREVKELSIPAPLATFPRFRSVSFQQPLRHL